MSVEEIAEREAFYGSMVWLFDATHRFRMVPSGDLVFFGTNGDPGRIHHVGMYVGNGNYVHAPSTGDVVKVSSLTDRISSRGDYVGASRF